MQPTAEQIAAIDAFKTGEDVVLVAGAGAGKTSTLKAMAAEHTGRGIYFAYNKAIATEAAAEFPRNTMCKTGHALAFRTHGVPMKHRLGGQTMPPWEQAKHLGITEDLDLGEGAHGHTKPFVPMHLARLVKETVAGFCYSADARPSVFHTPFVEGLDRKQRNRLAGHLAPYVQAFWADMQDPNGVLPFTHDCYLKQWQLDRPRLNADFLMLDEAQDANPVIMDVLNNQGCQVVLVGDAAQQIYAWRGAVDAMAEYPAPHRLPLTKSFRFGPQVATEANRWLDVLDHELRIEGAGADSEVRDLAPGEEDVVLCRTNGAACANVIQAQQDGRAVALVGDPNGMERQARGAGELKYDGKTNHPDFAAFTSWEQVQEYVKDEGGQLRTIVQLVDRYGVSTIRQALRNVVPEDRADVTVSTAHRSKGRQWDAVRIAEDFQPPAESDETGVLTTDMIRRDEAMLAYVALTRAKKVLDRGSLSYLDMLHTGEEERLVESEIADDTNEALRTMKRWNREDETARNDG